MHDWITEVWIDEELFSTQRGDKIRGIPADKQFRIFVGKVPARPDDPCDDCAHWVNSVLRVVNFGDSTANINWHDVFKEMYFSSGDVNFCDNIADRRFMVIDEGTTRYAKGRVEPPAPDIFRNDHPRSPRQRGGR